MSKRITLTKNFKCEFADTNRKSLNLINQEIEQLNYLYPSIKKWYSQKFSPEFLKGQRSIILAYHNNDLAGMALIKNTSLEKKICTFFISPIYRETGLGRSLLPFAIDALKGKDIVITVSESNKYVLEKLLLNNDFKFIQSKSGLYLPEKKEFFYRLPG